MVERDALPLDHALAAPQAFSIVGTALNPLSLWDPGYQTAFDAALAGGARLADLAHEVAEHPAASWWQGTFDRTRQILVLDGQASPASGPASVISWEDYAQRPFGWRLTSTRHGDLSCVDAVISRGVGDWPSPGEQRRFSALIDASVRVFEVNSPADWHDLCVAHPRIDKWRDSPSEGTLVPDWRSVAQHWDGVRLSFAGILTVPFVRFTSTAGTTKNWSWDTEGTIWLPNGLVRAGEQLRPSTKRDFDFPRFLMD